MKYSHQEGEIRPLYSSVPKNQCFWPWAVVGSYPLAYFYLRCILFGEAGRYRGWAMTAFAVVFLLAVEAAARVCRRTAAREMPLWAACWLALSVTLAVPGHFYFLGLVQGLAWHLLAIWCVLARFMENSSSWHRVAPTAMVWQLLAGLVFLSALARALYLPGTSDGRTLCAGGLAAFALCLCWELPTVLQTLVQEGGGALLTPTLLFRLGLCCVGALGALSAVRCTRTAQDA